MSYELTEQQDVILKTLSMDISNKIVLVKAKARMW